MKIPLFFLSSTSLTSPIPSPPLLRLLPLLHLLNLPPPPHSSPAPSPSLFFLNLLLRLSSSLTLLRPVCQFVSRFRPLTNPQPSSGKETISPSSHCFRPKFPRLSLSPSLSPSLHNVRIPSPHYCYFLRKGCGRCVKTVVISHVNWELYVLIKLQMLLRAKVARGEQTLFRTNGPTNGRIL